MNPVGLPTQRLPGNRRYDGLLASAYRRSADLQSLP